MSEKDVLERQEQTILATVPTPATATDARGIERIVEPSPSAWKPAPVEPDPAEVERLARIGGALDEKKEKRLDLYKSGTGDSGSETVKAALESEEPFGASGGFSEGQGTVKGLAEDVAAGPGQTRDEDGKGVLDREESGPRKSVKQKKADDAQNDA